MFHYLLKSIGMIKFATNYTMNNKFAFLLLLFACIIILTGCGDRHCKAIDSAYAIVNESPDSALSILSHVNQHRLAKKEMARYALVYTPLPRTRAALMLTMIPCLILLIHIIIVSPMILCMRSVNTTWENITC